MRKLLVILVILMLPGVGLMYVSCDKDEGFEAPKLQIPKAQVMDALSGKPINKNVYVDYEGKRIYFCCDDSRQNFNKNPAVFLRRFKEQGVILANTPKGGS